MMILAALILVAVLAAVVQNLMRGLDLAQRRQHRPKTKAPLTLVWDRLRSQSQAGQPQALYRTDAVHAQLAAVSQAGFERRRLLNKAEARIFPMIEAEVAALPGHRLMAQVAMGEILQPVQTEGTEDSRRLAFNAINAKRLDFAVFDKGGWLVLAIEYQGHGHYHETSFLRDAVKREALRKADVPFLEIPADVSIDTLRGLIRQHLRPRAGTPINPARRA